MPREQRTRREDREPVALEWQPIGSGGRARIIATGADTGVIADIDTLDLSRAADRTAYARRAADHFGRWTSAEVEAALLAIAVQRCGASPEPEAPTPTLADALGEWRKHESVPVVCTGFAPIDGLASGELPGGLPLGQLMILLGRPGTGKSALALQMTIGALLSDPDLRATWARGEMSSDALAQRTITVGSVLLGEQPVPMRAAGRRTGGAHAVADKLQQAIGDRLVIVPPTLTVDRIEAAVASSRSRICVVDYLQLTRAAGSVDSRHEAESVLSGLRAMSLTHGCATVLISSVARAVDGSSKAGSLVRNTAQGDFDADVLLIGEADGQLDENGLVPVLWRCAKNRHGECRDLRLILDGSSQTFTDAEAAEPFDEFLDHAAPGARR